MRRASVAVFSTLSVHQNSLDSPPLVIPSAVRILSCAVILATESVMRNSANECVICRSGAQSRAKALDKIDPNHHPFSYIRILCDTCHLARVVQSQALGWGSMRNPSAKSIKTFAILIAIILASASAVRAQVQVGDDLSMRLNGLLTGGYSADYGDAIPSSHGLNFGGSAQLSGDYYNANFLNFNVTPYYNQSRADSSFQSLTNATGIDGTANLFTGSRFPGNVSYHYDRNSTGSFGAINSPNFTTIGNSQGFGIGWSALLPDWPTLSVSYSQGTGTGSIFGTNEKSNSSLKTLNVHSSYQWAGWRLNAYYDHLGVDTTVPFFLSGNWSNQITSNSGSDVGINGNHDLPWHGSLALGFIHSDYSGTYSTFDQPTGVTTYTTNQETANANFHPSNRWALFLSQSYIDNLDGFFYQNIINGGGGLPISAPEAHSNSETLSGGASYNFTRNLYGSGQITYYDQNYLGQSYQGSYVSGTVGYGKRILDTFTFSGSVIESSNKFSDNSLGFVGNVNAFHRFGLWEFSGLFSYAQNVQTLLITYTTSYYNYNASLHRRLGRGMQWTGAFSGSHSAIFAGRWNCEPQ